MGLKETLADLVAAGEQERQRKEDAPHKLKAWLKEIDDLYTRVKEHLSEHASLRFGSKPIQLSEGNLGGKYQADILLIYAGSDDRPVVVALEPTASMFSGGLRGGGDVSSRPIRAQGPSISRRRLREVV